MKRLTIPISCRKAFILEHYNYITMVMDTVQIRVSHGLVERVDHLVETGVYANRSDVIRDALRRFVWEREVGTVKLKGNSVKQVREARRQLSKQIKSFKDIEDINNL